MRAALVCKQYTLWALVEVVMTYPILFRRQTALCLVGLTCMVAIGCRSQTKSLAREQSGIKKLSIVYGRFLAQHRGRPPANEAEFKKYVQALSPAELTSFGIEDSNQIFISNRDGKPYVIIYGPSKGPPGPGGAPVIAYEQEGKEGKRWVASALGAVEEVDETRFRQLAPSAKQ
jgi:hypothetical protein